MRDHQNGVDQALCVAGKCNCTDKSPSEQQLMAAWPGEVFLPVKDEEVRQVSTTGGEKGQKLARFDLVPIKPLVELAKHYGRGARKYEDRNWERGYDWSLSYAAAQRHLTAFWDGEDVDPETGTPHVIAAAWHCFALMEYMHTHPEFDNRPYIKRTPK